MKVLLPNQALIVAQGTSTRVATALRLPVSFSLPGMDGRSFARRALPRGRGRAAERAVATDLRAVSLFGGGEDHDGRGRRALVGVIRDERGEPRPARRSPNLTVPPFVASSPDLLVPLGIGATSLAAAAERLLGW